MPRRPLALALLVIAVLALVVGCGRSVRSVAPFAREDSSEAGGWAVLGVGPKGTILRFVPKTSFGIGIVLRNKTKEKLTLVDVSALDPPGSLIQQQGSRLINWNPRPCTGRRSCPGLGFLRGSFGPQTAHAVEVAAGKQAAVQLDFIVRGCAAVPFASPGAAQGISVSYRVGDSGVQEQGIPLGGSRLDLRMPSARDCQTRPKSTIAISGPYATGSGWTIPVSSGDSCSRTTRGALLFDSRLYESPNGPSVRVKIHLSHFRGPGLYRTIPKPAPALGPASVDTVVGIGIHGRVTFHSGSAVVIVNAVTKSTIRGRFRATMIGRRQATFRTYGAWRCLIQ